MTIFEIFLLAIALGIDCLIVSFSQGLIIKENKLKNSLILATVMGFFQGIMPNIGYFAADYTLELLAPYAKWITFTIFLLLGIQFLLEARQNNNNDKKICLGFVCLLNLGLATSMDALISGVNINLTYTKLGVAGTTIGIVAFLMSMAGFWAGNLFNTLFKKQLQILGSIILIFLAIKSVWF